MVVFFAQTLILSNTAPVPGDSLLYQKADYQPPGPSGINQFWNFSGIVPHGIDINVIYHQPTIFSAPQHSLSNLAKSSGSSTFYYRTDNIGFYEMGDDGSSFYNPSLYAAYTGLKLRFPFSYGDTASNNNSSWSENNTYNYSSTISFTADATGTLVTPCGTYTNTLRLFRRNYIDFNLNTQPSHKNYTLTESYEWYTPGVHGHILSVSSSTSVGYFNGFLPPVNKKWIEIYSDETKTPLSISENGTLPNAYIYNNPVKSCLFVKQALSSANEPATLNLVNLEGKIVLSATLNGMASCDVSSLSNGVYLLRIKDSLGNLFNRKLIIAN